MMTMIDNPDCCSICGYYLTTAPQFSGSRCVEPSHWQAAGLLKPGDYYPMAQIVAWAGEELHQRSTDQNIPNSIGGS